MAELKTKKTAASVNDFINSISDDRRRHDALIIMNLMKEITGEQPAMWETSMVGFGNYHYRYASGREGDWFLTGFSPKKQALTLYIMSGFTNYESLMKKLGKYTTGKGCLYLKKLEDIDLPTLKELIKRSVTQMTLTEQ